MYNKGLKIINKKGKEKIDKIAQKVIEIALHSVLFRFFTHQLTSGYSISLIRDPARETIQLYLRVAWTVFPCDKAVCWWAKMWLFRRISMKKGSHLDISWKAAIDYNASPDSDILKSASRILQCWSYYVKINSARHQHDTGKELKTERGCMKSF